MHLPQSPEGNGARHVLPQKSTSGRFAGDRVLDGKSLTCTLFLTKLAKILEKKFNNQPISQH